MRSTATATHYSTATWLFLLMICYTVHVPTAQAQPVATPAGERLNFQPQTLGLIPPGTRFDDESPQGWSHLLSFVEVKLTDGDVDAVSETVRHYAEFFNLVMLANVDRNAEGKYELDQVAIGFSMPIDGQNTVVTSETQSEFGGELSLIGRGVLQSNVQSLSQVQQTVRTRNSIVVDAPAVFMRAGKHREMVVRHYIWVFPDNGNVGTLVWLLDPAPLVAPQPTQMKIADSTIRLLPPNLHEDRVMDVDADKFNVFGIPAKDAFAIVSLPPGVSFEMSGAMVQIASEKNYTPETFAELTAAVAQSLKAGKRVAAQDSAPPQRQ